ncbi:MAG: hypothetical protein HFJ86_02985 [Oscillospiraceae bacterium]|nr:hypothetical protein [Oscillospiraceae bacterium]
MAKKWLLGAGALPWPPTGSGRQGVPFGLAVTTKFPYSINKIFPSFIDCFIHYLEEEKMSGKEKGRYPAGSRVS